MSKTHRAAFKWREQDGIPAAAITILNGRGWLLCCPLCGCMHETRMAQVVGLYKPNCLLRALAKMPAPRGNAGANWRGVLADWHARHPEAALHDAVLLLDAEAVAALDALQRKAARRAKRSPAGRKRGRPRKYGELEQAA